MEREPRGTERSRFGEIVGTYNSNGGLDETDHENDDKNDHAFSGTSGKIHDNVQHTHTVQNVPFRVGYVWKR